MVRGQLIVFVWRKKSGDIGCMCRLCALSPGSATGSANRTLVDKPTIFLVLGEQLQRKLGDAKWWEENREIFAREVWAKIQASPTTTNLTIKIKSSLR
jgi:hypothetical protein